VDTGQANEQAIKRGMPLPGTLDVPTPSSTIGLLDLPALVSTRSPITFARVLDLPTRVLDPPTRVLDLPTSTRPTRAGVLIRARALP
jgi:hypothetical protein